MNKNVIQVSVVWALHPSRALGSRSLVVVVGDDDEVVVFVFEGGQSLIYFFGETTTTRARSAVFYLDLDVEGCICV